MAVADAARMWNAGKGGAYYAPGVFFGQKHLISHLYTHLRQYIMLAFHTRLLAPMQILQRTLQ